MIVLSDGLFNTAVSTQLIASFYIRRISRCSENADRYAFEIFVFLDLLQYFSSILPRKVQIEYD